MAMNENNNCNSGSKYTQMTFEDQEEEKLPEVLQKLEIVPLMPTIKLRDDNNLPLLLNPFYYKKNRKSNQINYDDNSLFDTEIDDATLKLFGIKCKCNTRRNNNNNSNNNNRIEHNIINQTRFKHKRDKLSRRVYLRESLLKTIKNCCIHYHLNNAGSLRNQTSILEFSDYPTLEDLRLEDDYSTTAAIKTKSETKNLNKNKQLSLTSGKSIDRNKLNLKILIKNFNSLSSLSSSSLPLHLRSSSTSSLSSSSLSLSPLSGQIQNFTTLQSSDGRILRNNNNNRFYDNNELINVSTNPNIIENNISGNTSSSSSSSSSSCSQQARNNPTTSSTTTTISCDITIDELACYFETFVHIPKKMSSMAEMMYI